MLSGLISILSLFRVIVLPVQFQDCGMSADSTSMSGLLQEASGYFTQQINDTVIFELGPMTTLPKNMSYYGKNAVGKFDEKIHEAVTYSCRNVQKEVNFADYDNSGDNKVECVVLMAAGLSEADGTSEDNIWPQQNKLSNDAASIVINGKTINDYLVFSELWSDKGNNPRLTGIGTLCHEFGHIIGLVDFYDTDGLSSGGRSTAMWGTTALMDEGNLNNEGRTPPYLNAIDKWLLGIGTCEDIREGGYVLPPMGGKVCQYLKYETGHEGEFYLFEARNNIGRDAYIGGRGLLVYHIDRSKPTYLDRWKNNKVNCFPDHQCAYLVNAKPDIKSAAGAFYPNGQVRDFTELPLALLDIAIQNDGSVSFNVVKPFKSTDITVFQDAAIISWELDKAVGNLPVTVIYGKQGASPDSLSAGKASSITLEKLTPDTEYFIELKAEEGARSFSFRSGFTTKVYFKDTLPFIFLSGAERNGDGSFVKGTKIPLRVYNIKSIKEVKWYFNNSEITTGSDGFFVLQKNGTLKAVVTHDNGSVTVLTKEVAVL